MKIASRTSFYLRPSNLIQSCPLLRAVFRHIANHLYRFVTNNLTVRNVVATNKELLVLARQEAYAVGAFNVNDLEKVLAVSQVAAGGCACSEA